MTKPKPPEDVIVASGQTVTVEIPSTGHAYTLRAPTFGEAGQLAARSMVGAIPSDAIFAEALRTAIAASALPDSVKEAHLAAIDAHEAAQDHLDSLFTAHGGDRTAWDADARREIAEAQRALFGAQRARQKAEWAMRDTPALLDLRRHQMDTRQRESVDLVALCVVSVNGKFTDLTDADVLALPAIDAATIVERASALMRPTPAAEKN